MLRYRGPYSATCWDRPFDQISWGGVQSCSVRGRPTTRSARWRPGPTKRSPSPGAAACPGTRAAAPMRVAGSIADGAGAADAVGAIAGGTGAAGTAGVTATPGTAAGGTGPAWPSTGAGVVAGSGVGVVGAALGVGVPPAVLGGGHAVMPGSLPPIWMTTERFCPSEKLSPTSTGSRPCLPSMAFSETKSGFPPPCKVSGKPGLVTYLQTYTFTFAVADAPGLCARPPRRNPAAVSPPMRTRFMILPALCCRGKRE